MYNEERERLFVDMDGTLAVFQSVDTMETLYEKGYFANLSPHQNVVDGMRAFLTEHQDIEVYVLSSVLTDSLYALEEKQAWLDRYLPEIDREHRIFSPCGQAKVAYVPGGIRNTDMLLDDYSDNLHDWDPPGIGIKLMNGINGTKGTWKGKKISYDLDPSVFSSALYLSIIDHQNLRQQLIENHEEYENDEEDLNYAEAGITELRTQEDDREVSLDAEDEDHAAASTLYGSVSGEGVRFREGREVNTRGRLSEKYIKDGQVSLIGAKAETTQELARLLQCYRNPIFETARGFYLKDGYIISAEAVSSRLPGITQWKTEDGKPFAEHVNEKMQRLQADEFYMVHNHPTGDPTPSLPDQIATRIEGSRIEGFSGHIVLDHSTYALINSGGNYTIETMPEVTGPDTLLTASIPHPLLGEEVKSTESIARIGRMLLEDNAENFSFAAYIASDGKVREIQEISNEIIRDTEEFRLFTRQEMQGSGAAHAVLYTTNEDIYENITPMIEEGYYMDVLFIDNDYGMYWSQRDTGIRKKEDYLFAGLKEEDLQFTYQEEGMDTMVRNIDKSKTYEMDKENNTIQEDSDHIHVEGHRGTWYVIDSQEAAVPYDMGGVTTYYLLEHETYGDEAACVIVNPQGELVLDGVWNGFDDLNETINDFNSRLSALEMAGYSILDVKDTLACTLEGKDGVEHSFANWSELLEADIELSEGMREWKKENGIEASDITDIRCTGTEYFEHNHEKIGTFDCMILGEPNTLTYSLTWHDEDTESFHIHSQKDIDVWVKMPPNELRKLENILSKEETFYEWNQAIQNASTLEALHDVSFGMDETENLNLTNAQRKHLYQEILRKEKDVVNKTYRELMLDLHLSQTYVNYLKDEMQGLAPDDVDYQSIQYELVYSAERKLSTAQKAREDFLKENPEFEPYEIEFKINPYAYSLEILGLAQRVDEFMFNVAAPYDYLNDIGDKPEAEVRAENYYSLADSLQRGDTADVIRVITEVRDMMEEENADQTEEIENVNQMLAELTALGKEQDEFSPKKPKEQKRELEDELE